ncbi:MULTISPECIES: 3'-5' exonuclease [Prevotellaceae]|uniref:3'-5' exonuclease n=1 Tax=Leyella stercorea TaxID=363265 RepID=UPI001F34A27C|nr:MULTISPECIES: 3'-5' exonuclease [Prevotellaceae]MCF2579807.1 3'-5' exonuclease domain-containing protein 2 [Leyella stercorea]MCI7182745.1 3'-5' exonuclease domain-containing protein 2 [Prevotella sp.]
MKKTIYNKFDKATINALPLVEYPHKINVILNEYEAERAVEYLLTCDILGVDTETKPAFRRGQNHKVALLQVATRDQCFLFRLNHLGMPQSLIKLLSNRMVPMVGLSWHDDIISLHRRAEFTPGWFIDIQDIIGNLGIEDKSLQKLYANLFGEKISKRQRLTNWEADVLTDKQKEYAAIDAWACINLYDEIMRLMATKDYDLIKVAEENPNTSTDKE